MSDYIFKIQLSWEKLILGSILLQFGLRRGTQNPLCVICRFLHKNEIDYGSNLLTIESPILTSM